MSDLVIAYGMQKKARKAHGGMMEHKEKSGMPCAAHGAVMCHKCHGGKMMAQGGFVHEEEESGYEPMPHENKGHAYSHEEENQDFPEEERDMVARIMASRAKGYSKGGQVSNKTEPLADFEENEFDDLVKRDDLDFHYTGANSGDELGNEQEDHDRHDIVSKIMKSRRLKDRNPRPA